MNQHANHHPEHGPATLEPELDCEQIVSLNSRLRASGLPEFPDEVPGGSLVERLTPALSEASSGMGSLLTDLIRRTLRGGVQRIDDELQSQVEEKVDTTVAERMPVIEAAAGQAAEVRAREVAGQEVKETASRLDGQLAQTRLELASTKDALSETKTLLAAAQRRLTEAQHDLGQQIAASSHRAEKTARDLVREQVENLSQRSKSTLTSLHGRFDSLELQLGHLEHQLTRMAARVIELERPRGWRRLWQLIAGKRRKVVKA